jgi:hypothetical protein
MMTAEMTIDYCKEIKFTDEGQLKETVGTLYKACQNGIICNQFWSGKHISTFYSDEESKNKGIASISKSIGASESTIRKLINFSEKYSEELVQELIKGNDHFPISWRHIAQNLSLDPNTLVSKYKSAKTVKDFEKATQAAKEGNRPEAKPQITKKDLKENVAHLQIKVEFLNEEIERRDERIFQLKQELAALNAS